MQPGARSVGTGDQIWQVVPRLGDCEEQRMHCFNQTDSQDKTSDEGHEWSVVPGGRVDRSGVLQNDQSVLIPEGVDMAICTRRARGYRAVAEGRASPVASQLASRASAQPQGDRYYFIRRGKFFRVAN